MMSFAYDLLHFVCVDYWNIHPPAEPVRINSPMDYMEGEPITPIHTEIPELFDTVEETEEYCITPVHESTKKGQTITRAFGDLLAEELI